MLTGKELKIKRIMIDMRAKEISEQLKVSKCYVSMVENNKEVLSYERYKQWIELLNKKEKLYEIK